MGILDWHILDLIDLIYDRGTFRPIDPEAWKKWYPHKEAIGLIDKSQFPEKPHLPIHPIFPKLELYQGFEYNILNSNPTFRDCIQAALPTDYLAGGYLTIMGILDVYLYNSRAKRSSYIVPTMAGLMCGPLCFFMLSGSIIMFLLSCFLVCRSSIGTKKPRSMVSIHYINSI